MTVQTVVYYSMTCAACGHITEGESHPVNKCNCCQNVFCLGKGEGVFNVRYDIGWQGHARMSADKIIDDNERFFIRSDMAGLNSPIFFNPFFRTIGGRTNWHFDKYHAARFPKSSLQSVLSGAKDSEPDAVAVLWTDERP